MDDKVDDGHCWYRSSRNDLEGGFEFGFGLDLLWNLYVSGNNLLVSFFLFSGEGKDVQSGRFYMFGITSRCED